MRCPVALTEGEELKFHETFHLNPFANIMVQREFDTYENCCDNKCLILEILHNFHLLFSVGLCEVDTLRWIPCAGFSQSQRRKLYNVQDKIRSEALMVEFDDIGKSTNFHLYRKLQFEPAGAELRYSSEWDVFMR